MPTSTSASHPCYTRGASTRPATPTTSYVPSSPTPSQARRTSRLQGSPGVALGRTSGFTCVGNIVSLDPAWASAALLDESTKRARGIHELYRLVDDKFETSFMCAYGILRWCTNAQPSAWLGGMQPFVTAAAASAHDLRVDTATTHLARANRCTAEELSLSLAQLHLPEHGGFGEGSITPTARSSAPACFTSAATRALTSARAFVPAMRDFSFAAAYSPMVSEIGAFLDVFGRTR